MTISRMQNPRQMYGLGSLVKSVTKAVKGVAKGVKDVAKSPIGKAAMLYFAPMAFGQGAGLAGYKSLFGANSLNPFLKIAADGSQGFSKFGALANKLGIANLSGGLTGFGKGVAASTALGALAKGVEMGDQSAVAATQDVESLKKYLTSYYTNLGYSGDEIAEFVARDTSEYTSGSGAYAEGGRVDYAMGSPEDNAMQAAGIMGLPLNENPAGVTELDLRETGGFIPPVGVKEKADDIPAMLSNNEFVFTADAVRGMGEGDVNKGAERMYSMMKQLENGGRV